VIRTGRPPLARARRPKAPLFDLAPGGVCRARDVTTPAVRSYHTVSPLPPALKRAPDEREGSQGNVPHALACLDSPAGGLFSVALSLELPPLAVNQHPCPVEPGLYLSFYLSNKTSEYLARTDGIKIQRTFEHLFSQNLSELKRNINDITDLWLNSARSGRIDIIVEILLQPCTSYRTIMKINVFLDSY
jgi:hypothetical protein